MVDAGADLLVRRKGDADCPVRELRVRGVIGEQVHDLRDACFVIGAEQGLAVSDDQVFSDVVLQFRKSFVAHHDGLAARMALEEHNTVTLVILLDSGMDVCSACRR